MTGMTNEEKIAIINAMDTAGYEVTGIQDGNLYPNPMGTVTLPTATVQIRQKDRAL